MRSKRFWIAASVIAALAVICLVLDRARRTAAARAEAAEAERDIEKLKDLLDYEREIDESRQIEASFHAFRLGFQDGRIDRERKAKLPDESLRPYRMGVALRRLVCAAPDELLEAFDDLLFSGRLQRGTKTFAVRLVAADAADRVEILEDFLPKLAEDADFLRRVGLRGRDWPATWRPCPSG